MKLILTSLLLGLSLTGCGILGVEEPSFAVVSKKEPLEIRDYPSLLVAEVSVEGDQKEAASKGFRMLAGYIFGGNKKQQNIAMTAPVAQEPISEKIAMTAPVAQTRNSDSTGKWTIRFTMPSEYTLETLPEPDNDAVQIREVPPQRFAVIQFSGNANPEDVQVRMDELVSLVQGQNLTMLSKPWLAQYNPPWTPWFLRRNEVLVEVGL